MLYSTQRMGIRFCLNNNGILIDSKNNSDLSGHCRVCGNNVIREESFQLYQHSDKQCEHLVLSEICERLTYLISVQEKLSIPIDYSYSNNINIEVIHCTLLVDSDTRPIIELTLQDNTTIYLTIALEDSEVDQKQILALRQRFESVIEVNLSDLTVPSTNFTSYIQENVLNDQFYKLCSWLSFNPLHPLTRNIASIEFASIESKNQSALIELSTVEERIRSAHYKLEQIESNTETAQENLDRHLKQNHKFDLNKNIDTLKKEENNLFAKISELKRKRSELLGGTTASILNERVEDLRTAFSSGKRHIEQQECEKNRLTTELNRLKEQKDTINAEIKNATWLRSILEQFDCTFGDLEQELTQIIELSESYYHYDKQTKIALNKLQDLEKELEKKQRELNEEKKAVDFYKTQKFKLFKDNQGLQRLVESSDI